MAIVNTTLVTNIKKIRLKNGLSQRDLAKLINTNQSTISDWERRVREPDKEFVDRISNVFGIPAENLYRSELYPGLEIVNSGQKAMLVNRSNKEKEQEEPKPDTTAVPAVTRKGGMNMDKEVTFAIVFCLWVVARTLEFMKNKR